MNALEERIMNLPYKVSSDENVYIKRDDVLREIKQMIQKDQSENIKEN